MIIRYVDRWDQLRSAGGHSCESSAVQSALLQVFAQAARVYEHFPKGRLATLGILGNHDYGPHWSDPAIADRVVRTAAPFGLTILRNEIRDVEGLQIAGLDDFWGTRFDPAPVITALDRTRAALVLSHNPDTVDLPVWGDYQGFDLTSAHTV